MATCPRCKEDMPALSKICPLCGYIDEGGEEGTSISQFVQTLEARMSELKNIPEPSFLKGMGHFTYVIYPILTLAFAALAVISEAGFFWIACVLFIILSIIAWSKKSKGTLGYTPFNLWFKSAKADFEYNERIAKHSYGKSREVSGLINDLSDQIKGIERRRSSALSRNTIIWSLIVILLIGASGYVAYSLKSKFDVQDQVEQAEANDWKKQIEVYKTLDKDSAEALDKRVEIVRLALTSGEAAAAEDFFVSYCMGNMKDYECALSVVEYYKEKADMDAAAKFIERCIGLRYNSDKDKLKNLITR